MSRIESTLQQLKTQGRKALIPYVTAGFPYADVTPELMHGMVQGGADIIELGVPFSDPMADGPVIQKAGEKALTFGIGMTQVLDMVQTFRQTDAALRRAGVELHFAGLKGPVKDRLVRLGLSGRFDAGHYEETVGSAVNRYRARFGVDWKDWDES
jgi:hypothetical protein